MTHISRQLTIVALVASTALFANLGGPRLWDRDEPRNAGCAREMMERHDWVTPVFNGELRVHKPVLLYWLIMAAYAVFGVGEFAARFWSAALAVGTSLCTYFIGRRMFGGRAGLWAGIILATCLMFDLAGRAATPDSVLIFFSTLALTIYVLDVVPATPQLAQGVSWMPRSWWSAVGIYSAMAMGVLAKGPVGLVMPLAVIGSFALLMRSAGLGDLRSGVSAGSETRADRRRGRLLGTLRGVARVVHPTQVARVAWGLRPLTCLAVCAAIAVPWYVWVGVRTDGAFLRGFFWEHHFERATQSMEGHSGSVLFYPAAMLVGFFPWSIFAVPVLLEASRRVRRRDAAAAGMILAACWIGVYVGAFSLARTKLPSYVTPCYPALALATGYFVEQWARGTLLVARNWLRVALWVYALVGLFLSIAFPVAAHQFLPGEEWMAVVGLVPLAAGLLCLVMIERQRTVAAASVFAGSACAFVLLMFAVVAQRVDRHREIEDVLAAVRSKTHEADVASYGCLEPSWVFYLGQPIEELGLDDTIGVSAALVESRNRWVPKPILTVGRLVEQHPHALIITTDEQLEPLRAALPADFQVVAEASYFMRDRRLLLLGRPERATRTAGGSSLGASRR